MVLCLLLGFLMQTYAEQKTINEYKKAYNECIDAYRMAERGALPLWEAIQYGNITNINGTTIGQD